MDRTAQNWRLAGIFSLALLTLLILKTGYMNSFIPMPFYLVLLTWIVSVGVVLVMPILYFFHFRSTFRKTNPAETITVSTIIVFIFNTLYFFNSWNDGLRWQGEFHTLSVALENLAGFTLVLVLLIIGKHKFTRHYLYVSHLILFILLTRCAFPYMGELP